MKKLRAYVRHLCRDQSANSNCLYIRHLKSIIKYEKMPKRGRPCWSPLCEEGETELQSPGPAPSPSLAPLLDFIKPEPELPAFASRAEARPTPDVEQEEQKVKLEQLVLAEGVMGVEFVTPLKRKKLSSGAEIPSPVQPQVCR